MRDSLRQIRDLQVAQSHALLDGDGERLDALDRERMAVQSGLVSLESSGLQGGDRAEAEDLIQVIQRNQDALVAAAREARDTLAAELREMSSGRSALSGYRPSTRTNSRYVDSQS